MLIAPKAKCLGILFFMIFSFSTLAFAEEQSFPVLRGEAFNDPSFIQEMPATWIKQPIKHDPADGKADLVIALDQNMYSALLPLIQKYAKEHNLKIVASHGTCGISAGKLSRKAADIAGFCCPAGPSDRLPGLQFHTMGINAVTILVHQSNVIDSVTLSQARQVFSGEIRRWSELKSEGGEKGKGLPIQPVARLHCKKRPGHWRLLLDNEDLFSINLHEVGAIPDMITSVANNPAAIGYSTYWNVIRFKQDEKVKALLIDGYSHKNVKNLVSGKYPIYRAYSLTTWKGEGVENRQAQSLVKYLLEHVNEIDKVHSFASHSLLKENGWQFKGDELIGEPQ